LLYGDVSMAWKILSAEANEKSMEYLVPIAKLINLNEDKLYLTAVDNVINRYKVDTCVSTCTLEASLIVVIFWAVF